MTTHQLRYTGTRPTTFQEPGVGHVEPGGEFSVPEGRLLSFMRRPDVEHAGECHAPPCKCGEESRPPEPETGVSAGESADAAGPKGRRKSAAAAE